ncbi:hypothetical protein ACFPRL_04060 [Pseudoclavibacter helvolus]
MASATLSATQWSRRYGPIIVRSRQPGIIWGREAGITPLSRARRALLPQPTPATSVNLR